MKKTLIEKWLPIDIVSRDAAIEMSFKPQPAYYARCKELNLKCKGPGFYDPKIRSIHPWPARRPRSVCRAINLACILPPDISEKEYLEALGFSRNNLIELVSKGYPPLISYTKPDRELIKKYNLTYSNVTILDPMAGGGSIPLEALALGVKTVALEYNPVAYLILKATIEYPAKYGLELYRKVQDEVRKLIEWTMQTLGIYYKEHDGGYIIVRSIRCNKGHIRPLASEVKLTPTCIKRVYVKEPCTCNLNTSTIEYTWARQHKQLMLNKSVDDDLLLKVHLYFTKQVKGGFIDFSESDIDLILKAYHRFIEVRDNLALPNSKIPYVNNAFSKVLKYGLNTFSLLLNPRQALALGLISSYIRNRVKELYEDEGEFGAAVSLYLAFGASRMFDFNSILTTWNYRTKTIRDSLASYFSHRKFAFNSVYVEAVVPYRTLQWIFEPESEVEKGTGGGILPVLKELCNLLEGLGDKVQVYQGDALKLSRYFKEPLDIIHVDPPYYDVHTYSDMSEFSWSIIREVLEPILEHLFKNSLLLNEWNYRSNQVPRASEIVARSKAEKFRFDTLLRKFLMESHKVLKDDGLLVLWFSHRDWEAWNMVITSLLKANFSIVKVYPMASEHPSRLITRGGKAGFNRALIIVARKRAKVKLVDETRIEDEVSRLVDEAIMDINRSKITLNTKPTEEEIVLFTLATALTLITKVATEDYNKVKYVILRKAKEILKSKGYKSVEKILGML